MALTKTFLLAACLSTALAAIQTDHVYLCGRVATYVDGGLYVVKNPDGSTSGIVGDHVNGASKFEFTLALTDPADKQPYGPEFPILLTEPGPGYNTFFRHNLTPYINVSPGAFAPLRFTSDNSTLAPGETSWGWMAVAGIISWSPTGHVGDAPGGSPQHPPTTQGFQLVRATADSSVYQIYWNQTRYEASEYVPGSSYALAQCSVPGSAYTFTDSL
ncbi:hypothetical protein GE09DRAFT_113521 [Coniochaeta sp. 2T2.1]|nr:hypothetical protein GE09DRAFT_113521 [Coniochaeta sp. 2T2.1]